MLIPFIKLDTVYHIGSLNPAMRGASMAMSHEGHCLSVSLTPHSWNYIARLGGGKLFSLSAPGNVFVDLKGIGRSAMGTICRWADTEGLGRYADKWKMSEWDPEMEEWRSSLYDSEEAARADIDEFAERPRVRKVTAFVLTEPGAEICNYRTDIEASDMAAVLYAERVLRPSMPDLRGVWWNDMHDPFSLSAPRGGVFPGCVSDFAVQPLALEHVDDEDLLDTLPEARRRKVQGEPVSTAAAFPSAGR